MDSKSNSLNCIVYGATPVKEQIITIYIDKNKKISDLRNIIIKQKIWNGIKGDLRIWKFKKPIAVDGTDGRITILDAPHDPELDIQKKLDAMKLNSLDKIGFHFPEELDDECIHIIVQKPYEGKEIYCEVTFGRKSIKFQWNIRNPSEITLLNLKNRIRLHFPILSEMSTDHITINQIITEGKNRFYSKIHNDIDLADIIQTEHFRSKIMVMVDTPQQAFSSWTFQQLQDHFKFRASSWENLDDFEGKSADISEFQDNINILVNELINRHVTLPSIISANEATRREYISCILHNIALCFEGKIKLVPELEISGNLGRGPVDWAIMAGSKIIVITEAKKDDIDHGISQNAVQLHSAMQWNAKKGFAEKVPELYGIVTTALEWVIVKVIENNDLSQPINISISNLSPHSLPLTKRHLDRNELRKSIEVLYGQILWIFQNQFEKSRNS